MKNTSKFNYTLWMLLVTMLGQSSYAIDPTPSLLTTLYTWYSPSRDDYFTTSHPLWEGDVGDTRSPGYEFVRIEGRAWRPDLPPPPDTVALHGWYNPERRDNWIFAGNTYDAWARANGYRHVRVEGYVHRKSLANTVRLTSYYGSDLATSADPLWDQSDHRRLRTEGYLFKPGAWQHTTPDPELFGLDVMQTFGSRPLLVIHRNYFVAASPDGYGGNTKEFYDRFVFGPGDQTIPGYFAANSYGEFTFDRAGVVSMWEWSTSGATDAGVITGAARAGFNFDRYDRDRNGTVDDDELAVLVISKDGGFCGQTRWVPCTTPAGSSVQVCVRASFVGEFVNFATIAHELSHPLGTLDLYGPRTLRPDGSLATWNASASLMAGTCGGARNNAMSVHLDPWHKMALGWIEPRVISLQEPASLETLFLPQAHGRIYSSDRKRPILLFDPLRGTDEFFMLEMRGDDGRYDASVADEGLAIWHVRLNDQKLPRDFLWESGDGDTDLDHRLELAVYNAPDANGNDMGVRAGPVRFWNESYGDIELKWVDGRTSFVRLKVGAMAEGQQYLHTQVGRDSMFRARINAASPLYGNLGTVMWVSGVFGLPGAREAYLKQGSTEVRLPIQRWNPDGWLGLRIPDTLAPGTHQLQIRGSSGQFSHGNIVPVELSRETVVLF